MNYNMIHNNINNDITSLLTSLWEQKFDKIYVLSYVPYMSCRYNNMINEFKRVGVYQAKNFEIVYTTDLKFYHDLYNYQKPKLHKTLKSVGIYKASLEHYRLIKTSYDLNYNRICIFEDDIKFLKNLTNLYNTLNTLPNYDICLGDSMFGKTIKTANERLRLSQEAKINDYWADTQNFIPVWMASCYMLNRKGMEYVYTSQEKNLRVPDHYTYNGGNLRRAFAIKNMCIQQDSPDSLTGALIFFNRYRKQQIEPNDYNINTI